MYYNIYCPVGSGTSLTSPPSSSSSSTFSFFTGFLSQLEYTKKINTEIDAVKLEPITFSVNSFFLSNNSFSFYASSCNSSTSLSSSFTFLLFFFSSPEDDEGDGTGDWLSERDSSIFISKLGVLLQSTSLTWQKEENSINQPNHTTQSSDQSNLTTG